MLCSGMLVKVSNQGNIKLKWEMFAWIIHSHGELSTTKSNLMRKSDQFGRKFKLWKFESKITKFHY